MISLGNFDRTGHIDAFRSIVGDAKGARNFSVRPPPGEAEHQFRAHRPTIGDYSAFEASWLDRSCLQLQPLLSANAKGWTLFGVGASQAFVP